MTPLYGLLLGLMVGVGVLLLAAGLTKTTPRPPSPLSLSQRWAARTRRPRGRAGTARDIRWAVTAAGAVAVFAVTGWVLALLVVPAVTLLLPWLLKDTNKPAIARTAALEMWVRSLRSILSSGTGSTLEAALVSSLSTVSPAIRPEVSDLVARIQARRPLEQALAQLADDLADPTADTIVVALMLSARRRTGGAGLLEVLEALSTSVSEEVQARRKIESAKATPRAAAVFLTGAFALVAAVMGIASPANLAPYTTPLGQLLLAGLIGLFLLTLWILRRVSMLETQPRLHPVALVAPTKEDATHV